MSTFEAIMLICFGIGWPVSIIKSLRTKMVIGKSPLFMTILIIGYSSGLMHKIFHSMDWIIALYALNLIMILTDLALYYRYLPANRAAQKAEVHNVDRTEDSRN